MESLHIIGSTQLGGADQFFIRLVTALNAAGHRATALNRAGSPIAMALEDTGVEQLHLPLTNKWDLYSRWRIRRLVDRRRFDIVQTYMGRATRLTHLPPRSGAVHLARLGGYYKIRGYYEHADGWIGNTRGLCDYLVRGGLPASRVHLIGNFVPEPRPVDAGQLAGLRENMGIPADAAVILTLGRFIGIKGFDDLLRAFAGLPDRLLDRPLRLIIGGDGPLRGQLRALAAELKLAGRVHWPGWLAEPGAWYQLADWVVLPSRQETLGNVILEAWSHAKPVLATTTPGAVELIEEGATGLLTPCADPTRLAERLREALTAPVAERDRLATAGREHLLRHHGRQAVVQRYLDLYASLLAGRGA